MDMCTQGGLLLVTVRSYLRWATEMSLKKCECISAFTFIPIIHYTDIHVHSDQHGSDMFFGMVPIYNPLGYVWGMGTVGNRET